MPEDFSDEFLICDRQISGVELPEKVWDVAVVGAGPAGATAALLLARLGYSVVLLDKCRYPREKCCGDALVSDSLQALERFELLDIVRRSAWETTRSTFCGPSGASLSVPFRALHLKRAQLDAILVHEAIKAGACFAHSQVKKSTFKSDGSVLLQSNEPDCAIHSRVCVLATGAHIDLLRKLGLVTRFQPSAVAVRCYVRSSVECPDQVVYCARGLLPGYGWIFPTGECEFNIGCIGFFSGNSDKKINIRRRFDFFIGQFSLAQRLLEESMSITPLVGHPLRCGFDGARSVRVGNLLVVGEAAGSTLPFTGEGVGKAMETAEIAADVIDGAFRRNDMSELAAYPKLLEDTLSTKYKGYAVAQKWLGRSWFVEYMVRRGQQSAYIREAFIRLLNQQLDPLRVFSARGFFRLLFS